MIAKIKFAVFSLCILAAVIQAIFFWDEKNLICVLLCLAGALVVWQTLFKSAVLFNFPISAGQVIAFSTTELILPLVGMTAERKPLTYTLQVPVTTYLFVVGALVTLVLAHLLYQRLSLMRKVRSTLQTVVYQRLKLFSPVSNTQLWLIGLGGTFSLVVVAFFTTTTLSGGVGIIGGILQGFIPFSYAPVLVLFPFLYVRDKKETLSGSQMMAVFIYMVVVLGIAMAQNSRGTFIQIFAVAVGCVAFSVVGGKSQLIKRLTLRVVLVTLFVVMIVGWVLSDLTTAMRMSRAERGKVGLSQLVGSSISNFFDKEALAAYRKRYMGTDQLHEWDEVYFDSELLRRLCGIKISDNCFALIRTLGDGDSAKMKEYEKAKFWAIFPSPLLKMFGVNINKTAINSFSFGDYLVYLWKQRSLGSLRSSSFLGVDYFVWKEGLFVILFASALVVFPIVDALTFRTLKPADSGQKRGELYFSPLALLFVYPLLTLLNADSLVRYANYIIRTLPQLMVLYAIIYLVTKTGFPKVSSKGGRL